jgi:menaquinone-dependent protoporphyrinogen oxidase
MARILIAYATTHGQTGKIAHYLAGQLAGRSHEITEHQFTRAGPAPSPAGYDAVLLGSPVRFDKHARELARYVDEHREALSRIDPVGFFSVSGTAASAFPDMRARGQTYMADFERAHHWQPRLRASFAGAVKYRQYNPVLRWMMKQISKKSGRNTDTSRDWEYTDWQQVDAFASEVQASIAAD